MDDTATKELRDEDIRTVMPGTAEVVKAETDPDQKDGDGTDGDGTDQQDGDAADQDGTDSQDADGTDGGGHRRDRRHVVSLGTPIASGPDAGPSSGARPTPIVPRGGLGEAAAVRLGGPPPAGFEDLLSLDDVDRFLTTTALRTPFFRLVKAGDTIPEASYTRSGAPARATSPGSRTRPGSRRSSKTAPRSSSRGCTAGPSPSRASVATSSSSSAIRAR